MAGTGTLSRTDASTSLALTPRIIASGESTSRCSSIDGASALMSSGTTYCRPTLAASALIKNAAGSDTSGGNDTAAESTLVLAKADLKHLGAAIVGAPPELLIGETATVTLTKAGKTLYNEVEVTEEALVASLHAAHAKSENLSLVVSADQDVTHGAVVRVIDLAKVEGITKFAIHVERSR